jgi:hypothetical protein
MGHFATSSRVAINPRRTSVVALFLCSPPHLDDGLEGLVEGNERREKFRGIRKIYIHPLCIEKHMIKEHVVLFAQ